MDDDAVVVGAGIAGLLSALVLARRGLRVALLERDDLPPGAQARTGVPQAQHPHVLLARGRDALDELLPGFGDELVAAGAPTFDAAAEMAVWGPRGRYRAMPGPRLVGASRGLLEQHLRARVLAVAGIALVEGAVAEGLCGAGAHAVGGVRARVDGVALERRAALVVDASGRSTRTPEWLDELGHRPPPRVVVDAHQGYASRLYEPPPGWSADWRALYAAPLAGVRTSGALVLPVEGGRWFVGLTWRDGRAAPRDEQDFRAFAAELGIAELVEVVARARPLGPVRTSRATAGRWHRYDRLRRPPAGLVALGDAVCTVNPVYGQGMTAAALGALALRDAVDAVGGALDSPALPVRAAAAVARVVRAPWFLSTGSDARFRGTDGARRGPVSAVLTRYLDRLEALSADDEAVRRARIEVFHLLRPPSALLAPGMVARAVTGPRR